MATTERPLTADEIGAAELEQELRVGADVTVLDCRNATDFAAWHVDAGAVPLVQACENDLARDPQAALEGVAKDRPVRVICTRGNASLRVARELQRRGYDAVSVAGGMTAWGLLLETAEIDLPGATARVFQLRREARGCLSYVIASDGEALVVDPAPDTAPYLALAADLGARIVHIFDTHVHADHLSGGRMLAAATGAQLHLSQGAVERGVGYVADDAVVVDGDRLPLGAADVRVLSLPGHTTDMTGLLIDGRALVGGDSLFADSIARPDLEGGDEGAPEMARLLWHTLNERVLTLPDDLVLLPCHYAGGRLDGPVAPTLGEVKAAVPRLLLPEDAFVDELLGDMPPRPANYLQIISANLGLAEGDSSTLEVGGNSCAASASWAG